MQVHSRKQNKTKKRTYILPLQYLHQAGEDHFLDRALIYLSREYHTHMPPFDLYTLLVCLHSHKGKRNEKGKDLRQQHSVARKVSSTNTYEEKFLLTCLI